MKNFVLRALTSCVLLVLWSHPAGTTPPVRFEDGKVSLPLALWEDMLGKIEQAERPHLAPIAVCPLDRRIEGTFRKGLFHGTLSASFEVLDTKGHVRVPVLDASASLGKVLLNGERTSLLREGNLYTLGVDEPGTYRIKLDFYTGREQDRFARRLRFRLPDAGSTSLSVLIPEKDIEARLAHGALVAKSQTEQGTRLEGQLDPTGLVDLSWTRRPTHRVGKEVRMQARLLVLVTMQEALVTGAAFFDMAVLDGEADRVDLRVPRGVEVLRVIGEAVLQWQTEPGEEFDRLTVLLRHLVEDQVRIGVHFQYPVQENQAVTLRMPLPEPSVPLSGALGVQGPAGLDVRVAEVASARSLTLRDLPRELTDLTSNPLLFGFSFSRPPRIQLALARHKQVELTSTLIDDIQASTVLIEDGTEVTKLKLRIRNNTRQYLNMLLPEGAVLTHSLIDGRPVRPAVGRLDGRKALLFPLRQSERIGSGQQRLHTVRPGETLSGISNFYYGDPDQWRQVLDNNRDRLDDARDLAVGQRLRIPAKQGVTVEESAFVIELAYKKKRPPLGGLGRVRCTLPRIDVDTVQVTWHFYFPAALEPLSFDANLTQYSAIRYDPFRRVRDFLRTALGRVPQAWAGGKYQNILKQRKAIYHIESVRKSRDEVVLAAFPLTGERYRFKRVLPERERPAITVSYVTRGLATPVRWGGFVIAFGLALWLLGSRRRLLGWLVAGGALVVLLLLAHFFLGLHRRILWGVDLALLLTIVRIHGTAVWNRVQELVRSPWRVVQLISLRNLLLLLGLYAILWFVLTYPLLLSSTAAIILFALWRWKQAPPKEPAGGEVSHA